MLQVGILRNHFLLVCRFPITDTKCPSGHSRPAEGESWGRRFNVEGNSSPRHTLSSARTARGHSRRPWISLPARLRTAHRHAPPRPGRQCARSTKSGHPPPAPRPGHLEAGLCAPFCRRILGTPRLAGRWNLDTMDPTCTLGLLLLPLLITGTALGSAVQDLPGIAPHRNHPPPLRSRRPPGEAAGAPCTRSLSARVPQAPVAGRGSCAPVCTFSLCGGPFALKQRGQNSLGKPNPPSPGLWLTPLWLSWPSRRQQRGELPPAPRCRALPGPDPQFLLRQVHAELPPVHVRGLRGQRQQLRNSGGLWGSLLEDRE